MRRLASCPGFTLIELLISISLIALLISILLPVLASSRLTAIRVQCQNQQRQVGIAMFTYENDYDTLPWRSHNGWVFDVRHKETLVLGLVWNQRGLYLPNDDPHVARGSRTLRCPGDPNIETSGWANLSYKYRHKVSPHSLATGGDQRAIQSWNWPGEYGGNYPKWLLSDASRVHDDRYGQFSLPFPQADDRSGDLPYPDNIDLASPWHQDGTNALYEGGHVLWVPLGVSFGDRR